MPSRRDRATRARARECGDEGNRSRSRRWCLSFCDESRSGRVLARRRCAVCVRIVYHHQKVTAVLSRGRARSPGARVSSRGASRWRWNFSAGESRADRARGESASEGHFLTQAVCTRRSHLPGVDGARGDADCESPEGDDEDAQAEDEPDVHAAERRRLVPGSLRLVVLLRLLDSALAALLRRGRPVGPPSHHGPPKRIAREEGGGGRAGASRRERRARAREGGAKVRQRPSARRRARRRAGGRRRHDTARRKVMSWPRTGAGGSSARPPRAK
jgi:hypothetical protein